MRLLTSLTACFVAGCGVSSAQAAVSNTASANVNVKILAAVTITKTADLNLGTGVANTTGGTMAVSNSGTQTCTGITCVGGGATAATFSIAGSTAGVVAITLPTTVSLTGPGTAIPLTITPSVTALLLTGSASDTITVGGSAVVGANQAAGIYSATFTVSVVYQ